MQERETALDLSLRVIIIISVFVPGRSRAVQKLKKWVCTARDRPGTKTERDDLKFYFISTNFLYLNETTTLVRGEISAHVFI